MKKFTPQSSDVDPDLGPVGSAIIWVRGSRWYKMKGKEEFNQQFFFRRKLYFSSLNLKK